MTYYCLLTKYLAEMPDLIHSQIRFGDTSVRQGWKMIPPH